MNRADLIKAATEDIKRANRRGPYGHNDSATDYLAAIAKLLLAEAVDADASPGEATIRIPRR